ncbi:SMI1/KNR4 family protein [Psychroflexus halocasei]|nr:SMI1/KNR4 family protein [Psychroflexus halocasei]
MKHIILIMGILSFLGANSQNNKKKNYKNLTSELKKEFRIDLKRDSEKEFNPEFIRTTNLENEIINKFGFDGIKLVFESRNSSNFHKLGEFPKDCPWKNLNGKTITEFIAENFKPISKKIPNLISTLKERCKFIFVEKKENTWHLHYLLDMKLYDDRDYFKIHTGGSPLLNAEPNENLKAFNWNVPNDLKTFYKIHNGFGEIYDANFVMANEDIKVMAEMMNPICKEQNVKPEDYSFDDLLEFFPDGAGNTQCFYKKSGNSTVDWDHEVWEISGEIGFFEFINERMSEIDEE